MDAVAPKGKDALRLWLRLLTCANRIEGEVRARFRKQFATTLPRFDLLATLDRAPEGLTMGELSRRLLVSGGNVTMVADRLVAEGLITRAPSPTDRRAQIVSLTDAGRKSFASLAKHHEQWICQMLSGLGDTDTRMLTELLGNARQSVETGLNQGDEH